MNILIVEDDTAFLEMLSSRFKECGYEVDCAEDGLKALTALQQTRYDAVVLDVGLPVFSGIQVLLRTRKEGINKDAPILILSNRSLWKERVEALIAGANDYVCKPFAFSDLLSKVNNLLKS